MSVEESKFDQAIKASEAYRAQLTHITLLNNLIEMTMARKLEAEQNKATDSKMRELRIRHLSEVETELTRARNEQSRPQKARQPREALTERVGLGY